MISHFIRLREVRLEDYQSLFRWANDRDLRILSAPFRPVSWEEHVSWLKGLLHDRTRELLIIEDSQEALPIGQILLSGISQIHRNSEMSIRIGETSYRGRGFGTQALRLLIEHARKDLGLHRIELTVFPENAPAIRSYEKVGFLLEGMKREAAFIDGRWLDVAIMGLVLA